MLLDARSPLYSRAAVRWQARLCLEARGMELGEAAFVLGGLEALGGEHGEAVALALAGLLEARGLSAAARVLARWGSFRPPPGQGSPGAWRHLKNPAPAIPRSSRSEVDDTPDRRDPEQDPSGGDEERAPDNDDGTATGNPN